MTSTCNWRLRLNVASGLHCRPLIIQAAFFGMLPFTHWPLGNPMTQGSMSKWYCLLVATNYLNPWWLISNKTPLNKLWWNTKLYFGKMGVKMSSATYRPFRPGLDVVVKPVASVACARSVKCGRWCVQTPWPVTSGNQDSVLCTLKDIDTTLLLDHFFKGISCLVIEGYNSLSPIFWAVNLSDTGMRNI